MSDHTPDMSANAAEVRHVLNEHTQRLREVRDAVLLLTKKQEESGTLPLAPGATTSTVSERREPEAPKPRKREELPPAPAGLRWGESVRGWQLNPADGGPLASVWLTSDGRPQLGWVFWSEYGNAVRHANGFPPLDGYGWHPDDGTPCPWAPEWRKGEPDDPWALPEGSTAEWVELVRGGFCLLDYGPGKDAHTELVWAVNLRTVGNMGVIGCPPRWAIDIFRRRNGMDAEPEPTTQIPRPGDNASAATNTIPRLEPGASIATMRKAINRLIDAHNAGQK